MQTEYSKLTLKNKYTVIEEQHNGILGTTSYVAEDIETKQKLVIRILPANQNDDQEALKRFKQGLEMLKKLQHPNILPMLDAGEEKGLYYTVSPYGKGFYLNEYLEHRGELGERESVKLIKDLAEALRYAWGKMKIIHRNICPDSIFIAKGNVPKLVNFDLAKSLSSTQNLTLDNEAIGNPVYMSPEQARGQECDFHSDIYCLGLVLYQLLAGAPPFNHKNPAITLSAQLKDQAKPIQEVNPEVSKACAQVLHKMLEKQVSHRYNSYDELINAIDNVLAAKGDDKSSNKTAGYKMPAIHTEAENNSGKGEEKPLKKSKKSTHVVLFFMLVIIIVIAAGTIFFLKHLEQSSLKQKKLTELVERQQETQKRSEQIKAKKAQLLAKQKKAESEAELAKMDAAKIENQHKICRYNIEQIALALQMYANVFKGKFPEKSGAAGLEMLRSKGFITSPQIFVCPGSGTLSSAPQQAITEATCDYIYVGGHSEYSDSNTPILWNKPKGGHKTLGFILYANGEIKEYKGENWLHYTKTKAK